MHISHLSAPRFPAYLEGDPRFARPGREPLSFMTSLQLHWKSVAALESTLAHTNKFPSQ